MRRKLLTAASVLSLLLLVATVVLWVLSYATDAALYVGSTFIIESHEGLIEFRQGQRNPGSPQFFVKTLGPDVFVPYFLISPSILLVSFALSGARTSGRTIRHLPKVWLRSYRQH